LKDSGEIDHAAVDAASELCAATPTPRRVRITGRLPMVAAKQAVLKLDVKEGVFVTAIWEGHQPVENLKDYFNRDVVLEGAGVFRASGSLLRIDADAIALAGSQDEFFRQLPAAGCPGLRGDDPVAPRRKVAVSSNSRKHSCRGI
jgi:hypothetical protein